jgi:hypothetical protein
VRATRGQKIALASAVLLCIAGPLLGAWAGRSNPNDPARKTELMSRLQTIRAQIEVYVMQHNGRTPGLDANGRLDPTLFEKQLLGVTDDFGNLFTPDWDPFMRTFGPYLQAMPQNPFFVHKKLSVKHLGDLLHPFVDVYDPQAGTVKIGQGPCPGDRRTGWYFDANSLRLSPNDPAHKDL